jgi:hypothetical protein
MASAPLLTARLAPIRWQSRFLAACIAGTLSRRVWRKEISLSSPNRAARLQPQLRDLLQSSRHAPKGEARSTFWTKSVCPIPDHPMSRITARQNTNSRPSSVTSVAEPRCRVEVWNARALVQMRADPLSDYITATWQHLVERHATCNAFGHDNRQALCVRGVCGRGCNIGLHSQFVGPPSFATIGSSAKGMECSHRPRRGSGPHPDQTGSCSSRWCTAASSGGVGAYLEHAGPRRRTFVS